MSTDPAEAVHVEVVYSAGPGHVDLVQLQLAIGASVSDALQASGLLSRYGLQAEHLRVGIWGKVKDGTTVLRERDRIEIYRLLQVDPKEARRLRYRKDRPKASPRPKTADSAN
jgi:putative ubiquitin-RnfH superfamily antitoxin RatB of RatAB toxin-antitoxin module